MRFAELLPSAFMTKISMSPVGPRFVAKAIFVPSGDHVGSTSLAGSFVRFVKPLPSAFMTKISPAAPM